MINQGIYHLTLVKMQNVCSHVIVVLYVYCSVCVRQCTTTLWEIKQWYLREWFSFLKINYDVPGLRYVYGVILVPVIMNMSTPYQVQLHHLRTLRDSLVVIKEHKNVTTLTCWACSECEKLMFWWELNCLNICKLLKNTKLNT